MILSAPLKGVLCVLGGGALLTCNDAVLKWLSGGYTVGQLMFVRGMFVMILLLIFVWQMGGFKVLRVYSWKGHLLRSLLVVSGTYMFISGLKFLPLANATAISFAGPLFVTAMAPSLLGERVGWRRWCAVLVGFCGVLVMVRPTGDVVQWAALLPLAASFTGAVRDIITRKMAFREASIAVLFYTTLGVTVAGLCSLPIVGWEDVPMIDYGLFAMAGVLVGSGHFFLIEALRHAEAAVVTPFKYSNIVTAMILGLLIWGHVPDTWTLVGASIVILSGLYILRRETFRSQQKKQEGQQKA